MASDWEALLIAEEQRVAQDETEARLDLSPIPYPPDPWCWVEGVSAFICGLGIAGLSLLAVLSAVYGTRVVTGGG